MGAWDDLTILHATVAEIDAGKLADQAAVDAVDSGAKGLVADEIVSHLGRFVQRAGSPVGLLDAVAANADLADALQRALAYAALHVRSTSGRNTGRDRWSEDADDYYAKMGRSAKALASVAPHALGYTKTSGRPSGGALASVYT
ncbi:MAG: hypothetical protein AAFU38_15405 [Bacteroidota bacterium]